jgi:hypothetical protein
MRSLSRTQVGVAPLGVRVAPLPPPSMPRWSNGHDTGPSTRRSGFDSPPRCAVAPATIPTTTNLCQVVERQDIRLLPGRRGFEPLPGSTSPGGRGSRRTAANRVTGVRVPPGRPSHHRTTCGRRPTARIPARHAGDEGSNPSGHTIATSDPPCRRGPEGKDARLVSEKQRVRSPPPAPRTDPEVSKL